MENYLQNINDALMGIPEKFRLEKKTIRANIDAIIKHLENERDEAKTKSS